VSAEPTTLRPWIAPRLLAWFALHARALPWRASRDPYRIWVSEVMLQQTTVAAVVPYFERFLARFPSLAALAAAEEQDVFRLWEGLGYYRRARDLLRAARLLHERHPGTFPSSAAELTGVPGMGEYTRNAVLSQAFDLRLPILEANSQRVLSRLFGREADPRGGAARRWLWAAAAAILPTRRAGDFNQALMELGAVVCTPTAPRCGDCPLAPRCEARRRGRQEEIPAKPARRPPTPVSEVAVVVWRDGKILLARRPEAGRWAGLWEVPHGERAEGEAVDAAARRLAGVAGEVGAELAAIRHAVTRFAITLTCVEAQWRSGEFRPGTHVEGRWVSPGDLAGYPASSPQRRLLRLAQTHGSQSLGVGNPNVAEAAPTAADRLLEPLRRGRGCPQ